MSVAAVMLVRDEADVIEHTIRWLLSQVDQVIVADNGSTDGTRDLLRQFPAAFVDVRDDPDVGYWQSRKTTALAREAFQRGHSWVLPCDADEWWYSPDGRPIRDMLAGLAPDVQIVRAPLYNHIPTVEDDSLEPNPFRRVGWRKREHGVLPKVCCRARPDLVIEAGNHGATTDGTALTSAGLIVRHYSWRSPEQYVRKIRNGSEAYRATNLPEQIGAHWRMWDGVPDEAIADHYLRWFHSALPREDDSLIYDPAPLPEGWT